MSQATDGYIDGDCTICPNECVPMQSTGLTDKNGVEVFEGDILRLEGQYYEDTNPIFRVDGPTDYLDAEGWADTTHYGYRVTRLDSDRHSHRTLPDALSDLKMIVVGNIYENPELVGK
jgi:uncharacterized phage protein (TIGR01671 family)